MKGLTVNLASLKYDYFDSVLQEVLLLSSNFLTLGFESQVEAEEPLAKE